MNVRNILLRWPVTAALLMATLAVASQAALPQGGATADRLTAAVFVQNRTDPKFDTEVDTIRDLLDSKLTREGLQVVDKADVMDQFRQSKTATPEELERLLDQASTEGSALRLAQMLGADLVVIANLNSMDKKTRQAETYGVSRTVHIYEALVSLRILHGTTGKVLVGDTGTVRVTASPSESATADEAYMATVFDQAATQLAEAVAAQADALRDVQVSASALVKFTINTNIDNVTVALNGAVVGTAPGTFYAAPGLHQVTLTREWMATWNRPVNVINEQAYAIAMELSEDGLAKYANLETLKADIENQSLLAAGRAKMLSESFIKFEGELQSLSVGDRRGLDQIINIDNKAGNKAGDTP